MTIKSFGIDDVPRDLTDDISPFKVEFKGQTLRIAVVYFNQNAQGEFLIDQPVRFDWADIHYHEKLGYVLATDETRKMLGAPKARIATVVVSYDVDRNGQPVRPFGWTVKPWYLDKAKLETLREHNKGAPLNARDINVVAAKDRDPKFQGMNFFPQPECLWRMKPELMAAVLAKARSVAAKLSIGRPLDMAEIRTKLGMEAEASGGVGSGGNGTGGSVGETNFDALIDSV